MIAGKHAVVTGGTRGIGRAIARALYEKGANVSILSRSAGAVVDGSFWVPADVTDEAQLARALIACRRRNGVISILVNSAGIAESAPFKRTDRAMWERIIGTNLTGTYLCTRLVFEEMLAAHWGRILNIASIAGLYGASYISAYAASKHGVIGLTRSLAAELAATGVTVNALCPGYTEGEMLSQAVANITARTGISAAQARDRLARMNPEGRLATEQEVTTAAIALCESDRNGVELILPSS